MRNKKTSKIKAIKANNFWTAISGGIMFFKNSKVSAWLNNFILPNSQNNYKPHILHPKRVLFYAVSTIAIKSFIIATVLILPVTAFLTPDVMTQESNKIIELTNTIRKNLGVAVLQKNELLEQSAWQKAQDMLVRQYFAHTGPDNKNVLSWLKISGYKYAAAGENLAMGFSTAEEVVNAWTKSKTHYSNIIDPDFKEIGVGMVSGYYKNHDTTLVAQYFGTQALAQTSAVLNQSVLAASKPKTDGLSQNNEIKAGTLIKGVKLSDQIATPLLVSPENNSTSSSPQVQLKIFAPGADDVFILNSGVEISKANLDNDNYFSAEITLAEGKNILNLRSIKGSLANESKDYEISIDTLAPTIDLTRSNVQVQTSTNSSEQIILATVYLSADATAAEVNFNNYTISLKPSEDKEGEWVGSLIIFKENNEQIFNPVVLPSITAVDSVGNKSTQDINWKNITSIKPSLIKQYFFLKNVQPGLVKPLFEISSIFYKILLIISVLALLLNIFIEIRKQHPHIILLTSGLILILFLLIYF